jgi:hypothetical protein
VESRYLQGCSPYLYLLRTDGLAPVSIECTDRMLVYGLSKPSKLTSTEGGCTPIASMVVSRRETRYGLADRSAIVLWIGSEAFFMGALALSIIVDDFVKGCYTWTM